MLSANRTIPAQVIDTSSKPSMKEDYKKATGIIASLSLLLTACHPDQNDRHPKEMPPVENHSLSSAHATSPPLQSIKISNDDEITKRLEISYARNAAYKNNECPKLVEFESVNQVISREGEQLSSDFCEYFVFLNQGDVLSVHTSEDMHAKLVSPIWFDFNNGSFTAQKFDKYTIRLSYDGIRYHPANFRYDISLVKGNVK